MTAYRGADPIEMKAREARELLRGMVRDLLTKDAGQLRRILAMVSPSVRDVLIEVINEEARSSLAGLILWSGSK